MKMKCSNDYDFRVKYNPKCPHCGYEDQDWIEYVEGIDGELLETECGECEKEFKCILTVSYYFDTVYPEETNYNTSE